MFERKAVVDDPEQPGFKLLLLQDRFRTIGQHSLSPHILFSYMGKACHVSYECVLLSPIQRICRPQTSAFLQSKQATLIPHTVHYDYSQMTVEQVLKALLPAGIEIPSGFEMGMFPVFTPLPALTELILDCIELQYSWSYCAPQSPRYSMALSPYYRPGAPRCKHPHLAPSLCGYI